MLDRSLSAPPKLLDIAREIGVNVTTLQANFKAAFGTTIFGYVRNQRLEIGRALILEHGWGGGSRLQSRFQQRRGIHRSLSSPFWPTSVSGVWAKFAHPFGELSCGSPLLAQPF
jgi:AraC-like DNA-binding protein